MACASIQAGISRAKERGIFIYFILRKIVFIWTLIKMFDIYILWQRFFVPLRKCKKVSLFASSRRAVGQPSASLYRAKKDLPAEDLRGSAACCAGMPVLRLADLLFWSSVLHDVTVTSLWRHNDVTHPFKSSIKFMASSGISGISDALSPSSRPLSAWLC